MSALRIDYGELEPPWLRVTALDPDRWITPGIMGKVLEDIRMEFTSQFNQEVLIGVQPSFHSSNVPNAEQPSAGMFHTCNVPCNNPSVTNWRTPSTLSSNVPDAVQPFTVTSTPTTFPVTFPQTSQSVPGETDDAPGNLWPSIFERPDLPLLKLL